MTTINTIDVEKGSIVLKLLGDKTRLSIVSLLMHDECCVCELVEILEMSQPSISQHVKKLKAAEIVKERRQGQWIFCRVNTESEIFSLVKSIMIHFPEQREKIKDLEIKGLRVCCN
ncbi:metalloregulator ArsR/SmtB family transcription factor [Aquibacillus halophilus]|uniref:Metalloregulator ArsR/SmtB family transcription factor n=1 Tax=Aquibacillus halophilus TaxID=930132 RepID=A0A6A8DKP6_9BACI|nr:metalloregulator ArsR/SmtB family transcription factor [Aquibacillus halophilus]MRH43557.1 metalloregulator ArsR/SmtB family transcription factor [Aquibacillus halophilus]